MVLGEEEDKGCIPCIISLMRLWLSFLFGSVFFPRVISHVASTTYTLASWFSENICTTQMKS